MTSTLQIKVAHPEGLHARPASVFVKTASQFKSDINVKNLTEQNGPVNAKSILSVLTLGVMKDHDIEIVAEGEDSDAAIQTFKELIENNFE